MKDPDYPMALELLHACARGLRLQEAADYIMRMLLPLLPPEPLKG